MSRIINQTELHVKFIQMSTSFSIFQRPFIIQNLKRSQKLFAEHNFLLQWGARSLIDRVSDIRRDFQKILILSSRESASLATAFPKADIHILDLLSPVCDPEDLAIDTGYDLILSLCDLHKMNDLPGVLICLRRALKPDGVFLACFPGGETLHELRASLLHGEMIVLGGASPRVFPFVDKQQVGALLQRSGFSLPVVDSDILSVSYRDIFHVMADLRGMGEANALVGRHKYLSPSRLFSEAGQYYAENFVEPDGRITATFEMISFIGWAPHDSQPRPLTRGSGQISLKDVL